MDLAEIKDWMAITEGKGGIARRDHMKWLIAEVERLEAALERIAVVADYERGNAMELKEIAEQSLKQRSGAAKHC